MARVDRDIHPVLARLGAVPARMRRVRLRAVAWRAILEAFACFAILLPLCARVSQAHPYDPAWLRLALAVSAIWTWPVLRVAWAARNPALSLPALAEALDRLNPGAPDVFRTALRPGPHARATLDALEALFASWEPRLRIPPDPRAGRVRMVAALFAAATGAAIVLAGGHPRDALARMLRPVSTWRAIPAPRLEVIRLPQRLVRGDSLRAELRVEHIPAGRAVYAVLRTADGSPEVRHAAMPSRDGGRVRFVLPPPATDVRVRFTATGHGTARTAEYRVRVVPPPRLRALSVIVVPPAYARIPVDTLPELPAVLAVLPGTWLAYVAEAERPLQSLEMVAPDGGDTVPPVAWHAPEGDGRRFVYTDTVRGPRVFSLRLADSLATVFQGPWKVEMRPDAPPRVEWIEPRADGELPRDPRVAVRFRAEDDFGIARIRLHHRVLGADGGIRAEAAQAVTTWFSPRAGTGAGTWDGRVVAPRDGETVELWLEAEDHDAESGPNTGRSEVRRLRMPTMEQARAALDAAERDALARLSGAAARTQRAQREASRPDRGRAGDAPPVADDRDVRRVLSDQPRAHLDALEAQLRAEREVAGPERGRALDRLHEEVRALASRVPSPEVARAPAQEQLRALDALRRDQQRLDALFREAPPLPRPAPEPPSSSSSSPSFFPSAAERSSESRSPSPDGALQQGREDLRAELERNRREQEELGMFLEERVHAEAAEARRMEEAARQDARMREDVNEALRELEEAMQRGTEDGTLGADLLERMDRVRELLEEVLDDVAKDRLRRMADGNEPMDADEQARELQRAMRELAGRGEELREELETAIRMLETLRDARALRELSADLQALAREQQELAADLDASATETLAPAEASGMAARQEELAQRLEKAIARLERMPSSASPRPDPERMRRAEETMQRNAGRMREPRPDRAAGKRNADLAARQLQEAAMEMESMLPSMGADADQAEVRAVLEQTLEFLRWIEPGTDRDPVTPRPPDLREASRVAAWLAGRMARLARDNAFETDMLRREAAALAAAANALAPPDALAVMRRHAQGAARELLKLLQPPDGGGGPQEGDGAGAGDAGGGEDGSSGQEGVSGRLRGVSGRQMAANRMTQELLREMMRSRQDAQGEPGSGKDGKPVAGGGAPGDARGSAGRPGDSRGAPGGPGTRGDAAGADGPEGAEGDTRGAAANAQRVVAEELELLAESADDGGGAARRLRELAAEARALESEIRAGRLEAGMLERRQERFRARLLEAADALESRGHRQERQAETHARGRGMEAVAPVPPDSLDALLRARRDEALRLPLSPEQKRRVEWYYERLLAP